MKILGVKFIVLINLLVLNLGSFGQTDSQIDSLITIMCKNLESNDQLSDSTKLILTYGKYLSPFTERSNEDVREKLFEKVYYRFQRNCRAFSDLLNRLSPSSEYWESTMTKPNLKLSKVECLGFLRHEKYKYLDSNGETVNLVIKDGLWIDNFKDNTYSRLKFHWLSDCEFEIEFLESNNSISKQFNRKGDKYRYQIIERHDGYYVMSVQISGTNEYYLFHLMY